MIKARDIWRDKIRKDRESLLKNLDIEQLTFLSSDKLVEAQRIEKSKQVLRDVTQHPSIAAAQTVEELRLLTIESILDA